MSYRDMILRDTPYAYWPISGVDESGNGRHGTGTPPAYTDTTYYVAGGPTANFSATSHTLVAPWAQSAVANTWTVEMWVRPTSTITLQTQSTTGAAMSTGTNRWGMFPIHGSANAGAGFSVGTNGVCSGEHGDGYAPCLNQTAATLSSTALNHVVLRMTNKQHVIFINNGRNTGETSGRTSIYMPGKVGCDDAALGGAAVGGNICGVAFYAYALTDAQVANHYTLGLNRRDSLGVLY